MKVVALLVLIALIVGANLLLPAMGVSDMKAGVLLSLVAVLALGALVAVCAPTSFLESDAMGWYRGLLGDGTTLSVRLLSAVLLALICAVAFAATR